MKVLARRVTGQPPVLPGYNYVRPLGSGGFADVFLYEQDMPRRVVAIKVLVDDAINPEVLRTFNAETDTLARLSSHPAIVTIHHASISADGRPYFVMEYCPDNMSARYKKEPLPVAEVLDTGVRIAAALETAHRSGVLHRDIKPSNILLTAMGSPALADFGIAAAITRSDDEPEVFAMSIPWSSPEVLQGEQTGSVAAEVWSLGATLYTLLAGRAPFELPSGEKISRDQHKARIVKSKYVPTGRDDLGDRLAGALERALKKRPEDRFESLAAFAEELRWAQYELGLPPTAFDVVDTPWANAGVPVEFNQDTPRGPVISTVNPQSRRAERAKTLASSQRRQTQRGADATATRSSKRAGVTGAGIGAGAVIAIAVALAFALGVF